MIFDSLIKPALDSVTALVSQFHLSPEDKQKFDEAIADQQAKAQQAALDYDVKLNDIAGQNIRAEETSGDKFTERARPSFAYVIIIILGFNYILIPFAQIFGSKVAPITLPGDLLTLFGVFITGYTVAHTAENVAKIPGDSRSSMLGMTVSNKN